ncbi:MAG: ABC transporter permease subunit, partial [Pseudomonadota bacterium]
MKARRWESIELRRQPSMVAAKLLGAGSLVVVVLAWIVATHGAPEERAVSPTILPSPYEVFASIGSLIKERALLPSIAATLKRVLVGFLLAIAVGVPAGIVAGSWRAIQAFLSPLVLFGRNVPIAALIPLTILWFGIGESQKIMFIFVATVPFVFSDSAAAIVSVPERYVETARTRGASSWLIVRKVLVP